MTCEDCIHYDVCINHDGCKDFKDYSRFVELPCHTGEKAYAIFLGRACASRTVYKGEVIGFQITASRTVYITLCLEDGHTFIGRLGKNVFITREEAEAALKERENSD